MKLKTFLIVGCLGGFFALNSCTAPTNEKDYSVFVNPFIGTGGHGHTFPGAVVPHGMIQPSPDTRIDGWDACSGYYYEDSTINGFSHTHVSGTGCCDYGDVLLMPTVGEQRYQTTDPQSQQLAYSSAFSHENETAEPGYYSVFLDTYQVKAEISATKRGAIHRYTFPESSEAGFILDLDYSLQRQTNSDMGIEVISDTEICGHKKTTYWAFDQYINFYAKFSKPFSYTLVTDSITMDNGKRLPVCKVLLHFNTTKDEQVLVKVGVSAVDIAGARKNVESEIPGWDFDKVRKNARSAWNQYLSKIDITTPDKDDKTIFYTALYHTAISPNLFTDADGRYLGMDLEVHQGDTINPLYTVFSLWDTFRALHPLMTIIDPDLNNQFINSLIKKHQEGGIYPMWDLGSNYTGTMIGYHAVPVIVDAYMKGYRNFDAKEAYKASLRAAEYDTTGIKCPALVLPHLMPKAKYYKNAIGYIPCDRENESVAKALEYAYDDWCIYKLAKELKRPKKEINLFAKRAMNYKNLFDKESKLMRGRNEDGTFQSPFSPLKWGDAFTEGNSWHYTWSVFHDPQGLIDLMGGKEMFVTMMDSVFAVPPVFDDSYYGQVIHEIREMTVMNMGNYAHGNQPIQHMIYLYDYAGQPWKAQYWLRQVMDRMYTPGPDGYCGDEDNGQTSAWYVFSALGFYPVCPGTDEYIVGAPLFKKATLHFENGNSLVIDAPNNSKKNFYVNSMNVNGTDYTKNYLRHEELFKGGIIKVDMSNQPNMNRGTKEEDMPYSFSKEQ